MPGNQLMERFINSEYTLWVYHKGKLVFQSKKKRLIPLLDYIDAFVPQVKGVIVFDRIVGNAAALLLRKALCIEVYSPLGSQPAAQSLSEFGINYHFSKTVPYIINEAENDICPMEKLSLGKTPDEFYRAISLLLSDGGQ
jgi:hypothetical protein